LPLARSPPGLSRSSAESGLPVTIHCRLLMFGGDGAVRRGCLWSKPGRSGMFFP
jgi:hypothetical protein